MLKAVAIGLLWIVHILQHCVRLRKDTEVRPILSSAEVYIAHQTVVLLGFVIEARCCSS